MNNYYSFIGGTEGPWRVTGFETIIGAPLETVKKLNVVNSPLSSLTTRGTWVLQGFTSNVRYAERHEINQLRAKRGVGTSRVVMRRADSNQEEPGAVGYVAGGTAGHF